MNQYILIAKSIYLITFDFDTLKVSFSKKKLIDLLDELGNFKQKNFDTFDFYTFDFDTLKRGK